MSLATPWGWKEQPQPHPETLEYESNFHRFLPRLLFDLTRFYLRQGLTLEAAHFQTGVLSKGIVSALMTRSSYNHFKAPEIIEEAILLSEDHIIGYTVPELVTPIGEEPPLKRPIVIAQINPLDCSVDIRNRPRKGRTSPYKHWQHALTDQLPLMETLMPTLIGMQQYDQIDSYVHAVNIPPSDDNTTEFRVCSSTKVPEQPQPLLRQNYITLPAAIS